MDKFEQIIYINIDDSGKLVNSEKVAIYAGVVFTSKKEKDKFITQYRSIVQELKCRYCKINIRKNTTRTCIRYYGKRNYPCRWRSFNKKFGQAIK